MKKVIGLIVLLLGARQGLAAVDVRAQLRQQAPFPKITVTSGVLFNSSQGFHLASDRIPIPDRIAQLKQKMVGDASDAERYCELGHWYYKNGQRDRSQKAYDRAIALCRTHCKAPPKDRHYLAILGKALDGKGKTDEAEAVLRQVVREDPHCWEGWQALGDVLEGRIGMPIPDEAKVSFDDWDELIEQIRKMHPSAEQTRQWQRRYQEALHCFDQAIAANPKRPELYQQRASLKGMHHFFAHQLQSPSTDKMRMMEMWVCPESLADLHLAAHLTESDYALVGAVILGELVRFQDEPASAEAAEAPQVQGDSKAILAELPARLQLRIKEPVEHLAKMARGTDRHVAAGAAECLGILAFTIKSHHEGERWLRRVIALDPTRQAPWDMLAAELATTDRCQEAIELLERKLAQKDSAHFRFLLAKTYALMSQWQQCEQEVQAGLKLAPDHFLLQLCEVDLLLRKGDKASLARCGKVLDKLKDHLGDGPKEEYRKENYRQAYGCYQVLSGDDKHARDGLVQAVVEDLKKRGATITRDDKLPGKPVVSVSLYDASPRESDLRRLEVFPHLRRLTLCGEKITDKQLPALAKLSTLTELDLSGTKITDAGLAQLEGLTRLGSLKLARTGITGTGLVHLKKLRRLEELDLDSSKITDGGLDNLRWLPGLRKLHLDWTEISDAGLEHLRHVPALETLNVSEGPELGFKDVHRITDKGMAPIGKLKKLRSLWLACRAIGDKGLSHLRTLTQLEELSLLLPSITDAGLAHLQQLQQLRILYLTLAHITNRGLIHLKGFSRLEELDLSRTDVGDAGLVHLKGLHRLRRLDLQGTLVTDAGLVHLCGLSSLRELNLAIDPGVKLLSHNDDRPEGPAVSKKGIAQLQKAIPEIKVHR